MELTPFKLLFHFTFTLSLFTTLLHCYCFSLIKRKTFTTHELAKKTLFMQKRRLRLPTLCKNAKNFTCPTTTCKNFLTAATGKTLYLLLLHACHPATPPYRLPELERCNGKRLKTDFRERFGEETHILSPPLSHWRTLEMHSPLSSLSIPSFFIQETFLHCPFF